jgi:hypothetical protein
MRVFEDDGLWGLEARERFEHGLFWKIQGRSLPRAGWLAIDAAFRWSEDTQRLYRSFPSDEVDAILAAITESLRPPDSRARSAEKEGGPPWWVFWIGVMIAMNVLRQCTG